MISFEGKKILVTGASSGIGREISIHLSELGAKVVLLARDEERLKETISLMEGKGHRYMSYDLENIDGLFDLVKNLLDYDDTKFNGYVHCAGNVGIYPLKVINYNNFEKVMKVNTYSYLEIIKHLSKKTFSNDNTSIVYLSAMLTKVPKKAQAVYIASKNAGEGMSKTLSLELFKRKIRINSVLVGSVLTKMSLDTEKYKLLKPNTEEIDDSSVSKNLSPREVSNMVMFLMSDSAKYIIGESYYIDGGIF